MFLVYILLFFLVADLIANLVLIFKKPRPCSDYYNDNVTAFNDVVIDYNNLVDDYTELVSYVKDLEFEKSNLEDEVEMLLKLIPAGDIDEEFN